MVGIPAIEPYPLPTPLDLPRNTATWKIDPSRAVLLIHDLQRFFLRPLPDAVRVPLVDNVGALRDRARALGVPIAYTAQPGDMTEAQRGLLADYWGPGMRASERDRAFVEPLAPAEHDWVFTKWRYSAFFRSDLLARLRATGRDQLVVCGVYAHVGVLMTAMEAFTNDIEAFLVADAVADFSARYHRLAIEYAAERCAVVVPTTEALR
ncbi:isochorismatase family protein [Actinophytocola gossypii]|uniref:Isochorismatase family protein n=1 Tax=Actinophytocola gossypii TaxID=2812003 RepID=A0ABT2J257_9PSEU|nr:isochorismatase family protein [Actinophytocola gossypii]MCT2581952.1 isochorismatase family protein [Actinophytocola gossypii]